MAHWMNLGQQLKVNAVKFPNTIALMDADRRYTFPETNARVNQLAHRLLALGLAKGDKVAVLGSGIPGKISLESLELQGMATNNVAGALGGYMRSWV